MKTNLLLKLFVTGSLLIAAAITGAAQDGVQTRSIVSDDFANQRPAKVDPGGKRTAPVKRKRYTYKFVRAIKPKKQPARTAAAKVTDIGVTFWKLRPPRASEAGLLLMPVLDDNKERKMWLAERVAVDSVFDAGDRIRFAVESSDAGYLYVFGREAYADGSFGAPYPVFAASRTGENLVRPGMLFDIPDQREDLPYLRMNPKQTNYAGELLTVIVSSKPLTSLLAVEEGKLLNGNELADLEFGTAVEIFSRTDEADKFYSQAEANSACGVRTRELQRESSVTNPCGNKYRELTRDQALPQSIFRIKARPGQPAVAMIKLAVRPTS